MIYEDPITVRKEYQAEYLFRALDRVGPEILQTQPSVGDNNLCQVPHREVRLTVLAVDRATR